MCAGHGTCDFSIASCVCDKGWLGHDCTSCAPGFDMTPHGICQPVLNLEVLALCHDQRGINLDDNHPSSYHTWAPPHHGANVGWNYTSSSYNHTWTPLHHPYNANISYSNRNYTHSSYGDTWTHSHHPDGANIHNPNHSFYNHTWTQLPHTAELEGEYQGPQFNEHYTDWSECSATCGGGTQISHFVCEDQSGKSVGMILSADSLPWYTAKVGELHFSLICMIAR
jgi:hypothetical protein